MCTPLSAGGRGVEPPIKFLKRAGLDRTSTFRGGCWERGGDFFQRGCNLYISNKLKSEIFNEKEKFISKNIFPCHN